MKPIESAIRNKRFKIKPDATVELVFETMTGIQFHTNVANVSFRGIASILNEKDLESFSQSHLTAGDIVPESKIIWNKYECALGRLSLVRIDPLKDGLLRLAFSCIDTRIPLQGNLAKFFQEIERGLSSPLDFELDPTKFSVADFIEKEFQHPDLFERMRQYQVLLRENKKSALFQYYSVRGPAINGRSSFRLATGKSINATSFASYDYLGFSNDKKVKEAAIRAIEKYGVSPNGTLILSGKTDLHDDLEKRLAAALKKEDCLLFSNGFAANVGTLSGILRPNDLVIADIYSHASIHDGIVSSKARARFYRHNDLSSLRSLLDKHRMEANGTLIATEGLFSMEGTTPDLREVVKIAKQYNARIFIDECHSIGVYGPNKLGVADEQNVLNDIDIYMGSFTKSLGVGACGFICANKDVVDWLRFFARAGMFSGAPTPQSAASALKVLELLQTESHGRFERLKENIQRFREGLREIGLPTPADVNSPIIPIVIGDMNRLAKMNQILLDDGVYVNCILFPAVPIDGCRFRFSITADHSLADIELAINSLKRATKAIGGAKVINDENEKDPAVKNLPKQK